MLSYSANISYWYCHVLSIDFHGGRQDESACLQLYAFFIG